MNKQEMAEWLIVEVLGFIYQGIGWTRPVEGPNEVGILYKNADDISKGKLTPLDFIYSPAGFFAVWDAVVADWHRDPDRYVDIFWKSGLARCGIKREDRYEAFYNAVYQAFKK